MEVSARHQTLYHTAKFQYLRPERVRLHILEPEVYEVFQDKSHLWVYDPVSRIVEQYPTDKLSSDAHLMLGRIQKLPWDTLQLLGKYRFVEKTNAQGQPVWLGTAGAGMPKCLVWMGKNQLPLRIDTFDPIHEKRLTSISFDRYQKLGDLTLPLGAEVREHGTTIRLRYSQIRINPLLKEPFEFRVLPGMKLLKKA